jgi:multidrug efflux system membrane fusion protein
MRLLLAVFIALPLLPAVVTGCGRKAAGDADVRPVRTLTVGADLLSDRAIYTAEIRSRYESDLGFRLGGKVTARPIDAGARVRPGDVLAQIDPGDQRLAVDSARSNVAAARAELEQVISDEARLRDLLEKGLTARSAYSAQQTAVKTAQSRLQQALTDLSLREQQLGYTTLRADKAGVITRVLAEVGAVVAPGQAIVTLAQPSELEAVFDIAEAQIHDVHAGLFVQIALLSARDKPFPGKVREVSPVADPTTRTYRVRVTVTSPPRDLALGMSVIVTLPTSTASEGIAVPATALHELRGAPAVWIVRKDNTVELRQVTVVRYESDRVWLWSGVEPGDRVVTAGVHKLQPGQKVRLLNGPAP